MKKLVPQTLLLALALAVPLAAPGVALAQDTPPPPPPAPEHTRAAPGAGLGIGAVAFLSGLSGVQVVYDLSKFHVEGMLGFDHDTNPGAMPDSNTVTFGARGWYHLHVGSNSDFSLGGGLGVVTFSAGDASATATVLEPGALARVFLTSNFALHGTVGFRMIFGDEVLGSTGFGLGGHLVSGFGFTYFFR